jgi:hypothetical protein
MTSLILQTVGFLLLAAIAVHACILHLRLTRFRLAMADMGLILPTLDASVDRMTHLAGGFAQRMESDMHTVEGRVASARRVGSELAAANRAAAEAVAQLELLLRQHRRLDPSRNAPMPRELVEPKGFAERAGLPPAPEAAPADARTVTAPYGAGAY